MLQLQNHHEATRIWPCVSANRTHSVRRAGTLLRQPRHSPSPAPSGIMSQKHAATARWGSEWLSLSWFQTRTLTPCVTPYGFVFCACCDLPWAGPTTTKPFSTLKQRCRQPPATTNSKIHTPKCAPREHISDKTHPGSKFYQVILIYDTAHRWEQFSLAKSMYKFHFVVFIKVYFPRFFAEAWAWCELNTVLLDLFSPCTPVFFCLYQISPSRWDRQGCVTSEIREVPQFVISS